MKCVRVPKTHQTTTLLEQLKKAQQTLACYDNCLADMRLRRARSSYAIGTLEVVAEDARERVGQLEERVREHQEEAKNETHPT